MKEVAVAIHAIEDFTPDIIKGLEGLDYIHVDVMDGKFVETINNNLEVFKILKKKYDIPIIAHLMVVNPHDYIEKIIDYVDIFLFHFECNVDRNAIINKIKANEKRVGITLNPDTKISDIEPYLDIIDVVLIMGVYPGTSGQEFIPFIVEKVNQLAILRKNRNFLIDVDGGVNIENSKLLASSDILTSSSSILNADKPNSVIKTLKMYK